MQAWISIRGLQILKPDLFDSIKLPAGIDHDTLAGNIIMESAELEVMIPDPDVMALALQAWSKSRLNAWQHMYDALTAEYNPLYNKDGYIEEQNDYGKQHLQTSYGSQTQTASVAGYNSDTLNDSQRTRAEGHTDNANTDAHTDKMKRHEYGNIGVTTSQAMLQAELDLRKQGSIYDIITREFIDKFTLQVY